MRPDLRRSWLVLLAALALPARVGAAAPAVGDSTGTTKAQFFEYTGAKKRKFPAKVNALDAEGIGLLGQGRFAEAQKSFDRSLKLLPANPRALANRGMALLQLAKPGDALKDFAKAVAAAPEMAPVLKAARSRAYLDRGKTRVDKGDVKGALEDFYAAIRADHANALAYSEVSFVAHETGQFDTCLTYAARAAELAPDLAEAYANRGACLAALGRRPEALKELDRAILLDHDRADVYASRAQVHLDLKKYAAALRDARRASDLDPRLASAMAPLIREASAQENKKGR